MNTLSNWSRRLVVLVLFLALVLVLLWFQGILLRDEHPTVDVPDAPAVRADDRIARVERTTVTESLEYPGFVEAIDPATVAARVMATVLTVAGREGDAIVEGETLATLDDRDARARLSQAEAALEAARAGAVQARLAFERAERLHDAEALTTQEWEAARSARDASRAQEERAAKAVEEAETALTWFRLDAPFSGRILSRRVDPGDLATPGSPLLELYRAEALRFRVAISEERAAALEPGATLALAFDRLPSRAGTLTRILPDADAATGTVTLHVEPARTDDLRPGLLGSIGVAVGEREVLLVPDAAIERIGQIERARLVRDGRVVPVTVRTGKLHGDRVEVLSGLAANEEVVLP